MGEPVVLIELKFLGCKGPDESITTVTVDCDEEGWVKAEDMIGAIAVTLAREDLPYIR